MPDDLVERARLALVSYVFAEAQPDRGDVFSWFDDHADDIARRMLIAVNATRLAQLEAEVVRLRGALERIHVRSAPHPDDDDSDRKRNLFMCYSHARAALRQDG